MRDPQTIETMADLRVEIDALDRRIAGLLAARARLIDRAAELKPGEGMPARVGPRVEEVAQNARRNAEAEGLDPDLAEDLWRRLIEWSIARELAAMGEAERHDGRDH